MSYDKDAHAENTKRIAALLAKGKRPSVVAAQTGQPAARVEKIRRVLEAVRAGQATSAIAEAVEMSTGAVRRIRAAAGVAASKADGGRISARSSEFGRLSAVAARCRRCGGLIGRTAHTPSACVDGAARRRRRRTGEPWWPEGPE